MKEIKSGKNLLFLFMAIIIIIIVIVIAPFVYQSYKRVFNPTHDRDHDGIPDDRDAFPDDPLEWADNDGDGIGDNADNDDDNDGVLDSQDYLPKANAGIMVEIPKIRVYDPRLAQTIKIYAKIFVDNNEFTLPSEGLKEINIDEDIDLNWNITVDVPDDVGYHDIKIMLYYKSLKEGLIDINGENADKNEEGKIIEISYYIGNKIGYQYPEGKDYAYSDGYDDGNDFLFFDERDARIYYRIVTIEIT